MLDLIYLIVNGAIKDEGGKWAVHIREVTEIVHR
jgi:hypothetical protein